MSAAPRPNTHHVAVGLCILALGLVLILDRLGTLPAEEAFRYWPLALVVVGLSVIVQASRPDAPVVRSSVPWGSIVWILILGFSLSHVFERRSDAAAAGLDERTSVFAVLSGTQRTAAADVIRADVTTVLGGAELDLRTARPEPGQQVVVDVFTLMGGAVIYVPEHWTLDIRAMSLMGGISDGRGRPARRERRDRDENEERPWATPVPDAGTTDAGIPAALTPAEGTPLPGDTVAGDVTGDAPVVGDVPIEAATPPTPPRLVVRGFVGMGGLEIKSR